MPFAAVSDVEARLGRSLASQEGARVDALLEDATHLLIGYMNAGFEPPPYPVELVGVTARMVARALTLPAAPGVESQTVGAVAVQYGAQSQAGGLWLTKADRTVLRYLRSGNTMSVAVVSERTPEV